LALWRRLCARGLGAQNATIAQQLPASRTCGRLLQAVAQLGGALPFHQGKAAVVGQQASSVVGQSAAHASALRQARPRARRPVREGQCGHLLPAASQATGVATYTDDIPRRPNELAAVVVPSLVPNGARAGLDSRSRDRPLLVPPRPQAASSRWTSAWRRTLRASGPCTPPRTFR
jgi:hypothetical protein